MLTPCSFGLLTDVAPVSTEFLQWFKLSLVLSAKNIVRVRNSAPPPAAPVHCTGLHCQSAFFFSPSSWQPANPLHSTIRWSPTSLPTLADCTTTARSVSSKTRDQNSFLACFAPSVFPFINVFASVPQRCLSSRVVIITGLRERGHIEGWEGEYCGGWRR